MKMALSHLTMRLTGWKTMSLLRNPSLTPKLLQSMLSLKRRTKINLMTTMMMMMTMKKRNALSAVSPSQSANVRTMTRKKMTRKRAKKKNTILMIFKNM
jgi:hypothetical protein